MLYQVNVENDRITRVDTCEVVSGITVGDIWDYRFVVNQSQDPMNALIYDLKNELPTSLEKGDANSFHILSDPGIREFGRAGDNVYCGASIQLYKIDSIYATTSLKKRLRNSNML